MSPFTALPSLIRYLLVWRVQGRLVRLPPYLPAQISAVVGTLVAEHLPTQQAKPWHKAMAVAQQAAASGQLYAAPWPIESVIFVPPVKRTYGEGEIIVWELKLLGTHADHGLFLEVLLPAIEALGVTRDPRWFSNYSLWGRFTVQAIYVANGAQWQPLAEEGRLNLRLRPNAAQWIRFQDQPTAPVRRLRWITPFVASSGVQTIAAIPTSSRNASPSSAAAPPTLTDLITAFLVRMARLQGDKSASSQDPWDLLEAQERQTLQALLAEVAEASQHAPATIPQAGWPPGWLGDQRWANPIPTPLLPYLDLAAILHIGDFTHYGCGTFRLN